MLKYTPVEVRIRVECAILLTKIKVHTFLFEHVIRVIFCKCMNFLRLTFNASLLTFCWNISNDRRSSSYICWASVWTSEQSNWSSMSRTFLCRAWMPLKSVALSNSIMISHRWAPVKRVALGFICFPLRFIESKRPESDMSKVRTYQLSAHQRLQFKVHTWEQEITVGSIRLTR